MHIPLHLSSPVALLTRNCHAPLQDTVTVSGVAKVLPPRVMISYAYYEKVIAPSCSLRLEGSQQYACLSNDY